MSRFVPTGAIDPQLYDRPYYLGPTADSAHGLFCAGAGARQEEVGRHRVLGDAQAFLRGSSDQPGKAI